MNCYTWNVWEMNYVIANCDGLFASSITTTFNSAKELLSTFLSVLDRYPH